MRLRNIVFPVAGAAGQLAADVGGASAADEPARRHRVGARMRGSHAFAACGFDPVSGVAHFTLSAMAIACALLGNAAAKKAVGAIYLLWLAAIAAVQYTHPWTGTPPEDPMEMPMPLVIGVAAIVATGFALDFEK